MRVLSFLAALMVAAVLSACGGGGGSSGSNPQQPTVQTTAPAALRMPLGVVQQYRVYGGVAPYQVTSSDSRIVNASINGEVLLINSVGQGTANVQIRDRNTGVVTVAVTVGDPLALSLSSVTSYVGDTVRVLITGGTPPYRVSVLDIALDATVNGNELSLLLKAVGGPFDVTVIDALNQTAKMTVEKIIPGSPQFNLVPASVSVSENSQAPITLTAIGGVGPLTVRSSDPTLLAASVSGNVITLTTGSKGLRCVPDTTSVQIEVQDTRGAFANATVTLVDNPLGCGLIVSSNAVTVIQGESVKVNLSGMSAGGTITVQSRNVEPTPLSTPWATASYADGVVTITGLSTAVTTTSGTATVTTLADSVNAIVTVIDSGPPTQNVQINTTVLRKVP
ncbi:MAG: hypothetical protein Fur0019_01610 [Tibeticola sp.]